jgi:hypothetical protein
MSNDTSIVLMDRTYDGESLYDAGRDFAEAFEPEQNPIVAAIPQDQHGLQLGTFRIQITWEPN